MMRTHKMAGALLSTITRVLVTLLLAGFSTSNIQAQGPPNDEPCDAVPLPVNMFCTIAPGTVNNAAFCGVVAPTCGPSGQDVWYTLIVPASGNVTVSTFAGSLTDAAM